MFRVMLLVTLSCGTLVAHVRAQQSDVERLVAAMRASEAVVEDLRSLTDEIGGRPAGSAANEQSVRWAVERFESAGVAVTREGFTVPARWLERSATAEVVGEGVRFAPRIAGMPFTPGTSAGGMVARLVDGGRGTPEDFARLGGAARGAIVVIETPELTDVDGLFREYAEATGIEARAVEAGAAGLVYQGSRPNNLLYRHNASLGPAADRPFVVIERDAGSRILRLLRSGHALDMRLDLDVDSGETYESFNVIGEIPGGTHADEIVVIGAHLDSWDLGTGALDNGVNVAMVIDIARQMRRLGLQPARTIRFALFNAEEVGLVGSWKYTVRHADELDRHVMASSFDIGNGRITGFFTGGRPDVVLAVAQALEPVGDFGPFTQIDVPIVGTDNYDFMMQGVANLVANQAPATYGPNYHARSDTFDKVDVGVLRDNGAVAGALVWGFATMDMSLSRQTAQDIAALVHSTDLADQMRSFGLFEAWVSGERGLRPPSP